MYERSYRPVLWLAIAALLTFFAWAGLTEIDQYITGMGRIIPASEKKAIQHFEGGIITNIHVKEGDTVEQGDPIFTLRNATVKSTRDELNVLIHATKARLYRLQAEYNNQKTLTFDENSPIPDALQNTETMQFNNRRKEYEDTLAVLDKQKRQKTLRLNELAGQLSSLKNERETAAKQNAINQTLYNSGAISQSALLETQSRLQSFDTRIASITDQIPVLRSEYEEADNRIQEEKAKRRSSISQDIAATQLEINQLEERIKSSDDTILRHVVTAPKNGIINKLYANTIGGVVKSGAVLADLIPLDDQLVIEAHIATDDRGLIYPGLPTNVRITTYDYAEFGSIAGTLTSISADSFKNENGQDFYKAIITLSRNTMDSEHPLYPGMGAYVHIVTGKRTILSYLLEPIFRIQEKSLRQ